jgi:hypothetical protein
MQDSKSWSPLGEVAGKMGLQPEVLVAVLSELKIGESDFDIGMGFIKNDKTIEGLCRLANNSDYELTQSAIQIIEGYFAALEPLKERLGELKTASGIRGAVERIADISGFCERFLDWRQQFRSKNWVEYRNGSDGFISNAAILAFESALIGAEPAVSRHMEVCTSTGIKTVSIFSLGSRVYVAEKWGFVPFGIVGTVIGLTAFDHIAYVIADEPFVGGNTLNGRLSTKRGFVVPVAALGPAEMSIEV